MKFTYDNFEIYGTIEADNPDEAKALVARKIDNTRRTIADHEKTLSYWRDFQKHLNEKWT